MDTRMDIRLLIIKRGSSFWRHTSSIQGFCEARSYPFDLDVTTNSFRAYPHHHDSLFDMQLGGKKKKKKKGQRE